MPGSNVAAMRILHTSDWHLGRTLHRVDLSNAHQQFLDHLVSLAREEQVDAVLVSGDVFDRALPPLESVSMLNDALGRLCEVAPVVLIPGNHDSPQRLGLNAGLLGARLHIQATLSGIATPIIIGDRDGHDGLAVYGLPYLDPDMTRDELTRLCSTGDDADDTADGGMAQQRLARSHEAVVGAALGLVSADLAGRRAESSTRIPAVVMAHAFVTGGQPSESERDLRIGGVDSAPASRFAECGAVYVALGHLHGAQRVGAQRVGAQKETPANGTGSTGAGSTGAGSATAGEDGAVMRYAGSPLAFAFSEQHHHKSTALINFRADGRVSGVELVPTPVPRRLSDVTGSLDEVLGSRFAGQHDDWTRIVVTGDAQPPDLQKTVRKAFPHALDVRFESTAAKQSIRTQPGAQVDPMDVLAEFAKSAGGRDANPAELAALRAALEAAIRQQVR